MIIETKDLAAATAYAAQSIAVRPDPPVMAAMRLVAAGNTLTCEGVGDDLRSSMTVTSNAFDTGEAWEALVGGRHLAAVAARLSGAVDVALGGTFLSVECGRRERYRFPTIDGELVRQDALPEAVGQVDAGELAEALRQVGAVVDANAGNPAQHFVRIVCDGGEDVLRLQGFRSALAARQAVAWAPAECEPFELHADGAALRDLLRGIDGPITLHADASRVGISTPTTAAVVRLAAVGHPVLDRAFAAGASCLEVDREPLIDALDKVLLFTDPDHPRVALEPSPGALRLEAYGRDERAELEIDAAWNGPEGARFGVNPVYLKTAVDTVRADTLRILCDPAKAAAPLLFEAGDHLVALVPVKPQEVAR